MTGDAGWMRAALGLAARGLGRTAPNPSVGCIIVRDGIVVGRGRTGDGGRPHAETVALARAGERARGATAYVTLEPCAHHGATPPCAEALVAAGIARAVVAIRDPDKRVAGRGIERLRGAGIEVVPDVLAEAARGLNLGFLSRIERGRPMVTLKLATTLDGRIATSGGESRWITGEAARQAGHLLRRSHDAVCVGSGTVLADDPALTVRLPGLEQPAPLRIAVDGRLQTPLTAKLVRDAGAVPTLILTLDTTDPLRRQAFRDCGVEVAALPAGADGRIDLKAALALLGGRGLTRILVEGGATLAAALLARGLVDRLAWFRSGGLLGGDALPAIGPLGLRHLADQQRFMRLATTRLGEDVLESWAVQP